MKKQSLLKVFVFASCLFFITNVIAQDKNIVETAIGSDDHTTLVAAVKAADLVGVLTSDGPFTVFAPTNAAFAKLPEGTVESLLKYHVIAGKFMAADVIGLINDNGGKAIITTVNGDNLTATLKGGSVYIVDGNGNESKVIAADLNNTNGVIHVVDTVVLPKS
jgi:uncharacterized surface protein with fasciclin (FAS1) repeats